MMISNRSSFIFEVSGEATSHPIVSLHGILNSKTAADALKRLTSKLKKLSFTNLYIDLSNINCLDDYGAFVLSDLKHSFGLADKNFKIMNAPDKFKRTLSLINLNFEKHCPSAGRRADKNIIIDFGELIISSFKSITCIISFIGSIVLATLKIFKKPKSLRVEDIILNMKTTGVDALPVVGMISFLLGLIMAFVSALQLRQFGANIYVASLVALSMVSELGPIMTAIVVSGRSGSSYAAEISTMKISEEIDALSTMGFDPTLFLVIPRLFAAIIVIPILTVFAIFFAITGGMVIGVTMLDLTVSAYINQTVESLDIFELMWGLSKSLVFAVLIAGVGCFKGFQAKGGASSVGNAATSAVVSIIFLIILFDSLFAIIRSYWE